MIRYIVGSSDECEELEEAMKVLIAHSINPFATGNSYQVKYYDPSEDEEQYKGYIEVECIGEMTLTKPDRVSVDGGAIVAKIGKHKYIISGHCNFAD